MKKEIIERAKDFNLKARYLICDHICSQLQDNVVYETYDDPYYLVCNLRNTLYTRKDGFWIPAITVYTFEQLLDFTNKRYRMLKNFNDKPSYIDI